MNRALLLQAGIGIVVMGAGAALLLRPGVLRGVEPRDYVRRIAGAMLFAFGLMAAAFAVALTAMGV